VSYNRIIVREHAGQRMLERRITYRELETVLRSGEIIEEYPDDRPYPSRLMLGWCGQRPVHVVAADAHEAQTTIVITVYEPEPELWTEDFRNRKERRS
jgi:Domain of unknown function (DUF4258)